MIRHLKVRSRNTSCEPLKLIEVPITTIYRMGSTTKTSNIMRNPNRKHIEINSVEGCKISSNKILMKKRFQHARIRTAKWFTINRNDHNAERFEYYLNKWDTPIIVKKYNSSKGKGIYLLHDLIEFYDWWREHDDIENYIFERYYSYTKEYRIHVSKFGCFYASRKMLIDNAEDRWHRHSNNSVFINEENPMFDKPETWNKIIKACINALKALHLDIAAFDVKVNRNGKYIILESNTAPSLKDTGIIKYTEELKKIINSKYNDIQIP